MRELEAKNRRRETLRLCYPTIVYCAIYLLWWSRLEKTVQLHYTVIHTKIDDLIPFSEIFVLPYLAWFFYVAFVVFYLLLSGEHEDYIRAIAFMGTGMTLFLLISTFFPNMLQLRPVALPRDNFLTRMVAFVWSHDTATNVFPSIHVYNAIGAYLAVKNSPRFSAVAKRVSFWLSASIVLSTMFVKQHSVYDVACAVALCVIMNYVVYHTTALNGVLVKFVDLSYELVPTNRD